MYPDRNVAVPWQSMKGYCRSKGSIWLTIVIDMFTPDFLGMIGMEDCVPDSTELQTQVPSMNMKLKECIQNGTVTVKGIDGSNRVKACTLLWGEDYLVPANICLLDVHAKLITESEINNLSWCTNQLNAHWSEMSLYDTTTHVFECALRYMKWMIATQHRLHI